MGDLARSRGKWYLFWTRRSPLRTGVVHPDMLLVHPSILPSQVQPEEEEALINAYKNGPDQLQERGIHIGGTKYMFLRPNDNSFYGKKGVRIAQHCL